MYLASICKAKRSCVGSICNVKRRESGTLQNDDYAIFYLQKRPKYVVSSAKRLSTCSFVSQYALNTTSLLHLNMQFLPCKYLQHVYDVETVVDWRLQSSKWNGDSRRHRQVCALSKLE